MATFKCTWCGEHKISESKGHELLENENINNCPICGKRSWGNSMTVSCNLDVDGWKYSYGKMCKIT